MSDTPISLDELKNTEEVTSTLATISRLTGFRIELRELEDPRNEDKWLTFSNNLNKALNLLEMLIMITQAKGDARNLVEQELIGDKAKGYQKMNLQEITGQRAKNIAKFIKKHLIS